MRSGGTSRESDVIYQYLLETLHTHLWLIAFSRDVSRPQTLPLAGCQPPGILGLLTLGLMHLLLVMLEVGTSEC